MTVIFARIPTRGCFRRSVGVDASDLRVRTICSYVSADSSIGEPAFNVYTHSCAGPCRFHLIAQIRGAAKVCQRTQDARADPIVGITLHHVAQERQWLFVAPF